MCNVCMYVCLYSSIQAGSMVEIAPVLVGDEGKGRIFDKICTVVADSEEATDVLGSNVVAILIDN